jgi:hypothetical protein
MTGLKYVIAAIAAASTIAIHSASAEAHRRCGYDRYGYHAPDFSGCYRYSHEGWGFVPAYNPYPEGSYYAPRYEGYYAVAPGCYYDNGYDLRVHLVCPRNW